ncbi:MAG: Ig-like domain-containing protein [Gemmatimonadaceae bacterium]|nr:Ig-like domain-containing protein [Gemmatimonadaceae bacterium]
MPLRVHAVVASMRSIARASTTMLMMLLLAACEDEHGPNISGVPGFDIRWVEISPSVDTLFVPDTIRVTDRLQLQATAFGVGSERLPVSRYVWTSSDTSIARVDSSGLVLPKRTGVVEISASATRIGKATVVILPAVQRIDVLASRDSVFIDEPVVAANAPLQMSARVVDNSGQPSSGTRITWSATPNSVATIDSTGSLRAIAPGSVVVVARSSTASIQGQRTIQVVPVVRSVALSATSAQVLSGDTVRLSAVASGYANETITRVFRWSSSNTSIATIDQNGQAIFIAPGAVTFTASTAYRSASASVTSLARELVTIAGGRAFSCGLANLGRLFCWGGGDVGQTASPPDSTCFGDQYDSGGACAIQAKRAGAPFQSYARLATSRSSGCAIDDSGMLYCWGSGIHGTIGNGTGSGSQSPTLATVLNERFVELAGGGDHFCALSTQRFVFCWGRDDFGQLGDTLQINSTTPIPVVGPDGLMATRLRFSAIAAGFNHTCGIEQTTGLAWCWGNGEAGQRGDGATALIQRPRRVNSEVRFRQIDADSTHTCAVAEAGQLYCWGSNTFGQLGVTTVSSSSIPVLVGAGYQQVVTGLHFTCAVSTTGVISCWGLNQRGQLGRGEGTPTGFSTTPAAIVVNRTFRTMTAGARHACAIDTGGETWCWGSNVLGGLGNGLQAAIRAVPERIAPLR